MMKMGVFSKLVLGLLGVVLLQVEHIQCGKHKGCGQELCGDVIIEYPFGIGPKCSFDNDYFAVSCVNNSNNSPKPILSKLGLELIEVQSYSEDGQITVNMPAFKVCNNSGTTEIQWSSPNFSSTPFYFDSTQNVFVSVGCHGNASLYGRQGRPIGGCHSSCNPPGQTSHGPCAGYNCCQVDFDDDYDYGYLDSGYSIGVTTGNEASCRSAFFISSSFLHTGGHSTVAITNTSVVPVVLLYYLPIIQGNHRGPNDLFNTSRKIIVYLILLPVICTVLVSCCCLWLLRHWKTKERRKELKLRAIYFMERLEETLLFDREVAEKTKLFTINELKKATDNFNGDRILGQGGQGTVYKGMLTNGQVIAIKRANTFEEDQWKQFVNEVILLSQVSHKNVVKLLGCCLESKIPLLVYEFVPNGTLSEHIHNSKVKCLLTWELRLRIASEVASAIAYLHCSSSTPIFHRDVKSSNILLGDNYEVKVVDFGISKAVRIDQTHLTTCVQGTFGYLDPEYFESSQFSEKSDVYSFGVILVELLTGQKPIRASKSDGETSLVEYFISTMNKFCLDSILDPIVLQGDNKDMVISVAILAKRCLHIRGVERPTMKEVAMELESLTKKMSLDIVVRQELIETQDGIIDQLNIDTCSVLTCSTLYGAVDETEIHCEEQPLSFTA